MTMFRLSDEQRRYFYALCSDGNITRAAQRLFLSRQGLSRSMRELEKSLGTSLFVRGKRGVTLTSAGRILLRHLREEDRAWENCMAALRVIEGEPELVRVGLLSMFVGYEQKRRLLSRFERNGELRIEIVDGDHDVFWEAIAAGNMECAVTIRPPDHLGIPCVDLGKGAIEVLLSRDDPLAQKQTVDFTRDLRGKTVVQTSPYKGRLYEAVFRSHGILSEPILHDRNLMLAQVSARHHCFIIQAEYAADLVNDEVCRRPLVNVPFEMSSVLVLRPDLSPLALEVARAIAAPYSVSPT